MAYTGSRPILPGRTTRQINPVTGAVEKSEYSNFELESDISALDGAPNKNHVPGEGYFPSDIAMERRFDGSDPAGPMDPMDDAGEGPRQDPNYFHTNPDLFNGVPSADVTDNAGHLLRSTDYSVYSNYIFDGVPSAETLEVNVGHVERDQDDPGVPTGGGATDPFEFQGVAASKVMANPGRVEPAAETPGVYGHEHVMEYRGVPSARVL